MKSIRNWLFVAMPIVALIAMATTELRRSTIPSSNWRDVAVSGRGYIHTVDENGDNPIWLRCVRLAINANGLLCATVDGELRPLEPSISVPSDWTRIDIDTVGRVTINTSGSAGLSIGSIQLTTFFGEVPGDPIMITNDNDQLGPPVTNEPGSSGAGFLMQRATLDHVMPLTRRNIVIFAITIIWLTGGIWYTRSHKMP